MRQCGIIVVIYIDDLLIINDSFSKCASNVTFVESILVNLGFIINYGKSKLIPLHECKYLGFIYNSKEMNVKLPDSKREKMVTLVKKFKLDQSYKIRKFAETLGFLISCCPAVNYGLVFTKACERLKFKSLSRNGDNYEGHLTINFDAFEELQCWKNVGSKSSNSIRFPVHTLEIYSDASKSGWGAGCNDESTGGFWSYDESLSSMNFLELKAAFFALKCFAHDRSNCQILLHIDNQTALAYINRMGGVQFQNLNSLAKEIWKWCETRNIWICAKYIASKDNSVADAESRKSDFIEEFELSTEAFEKICRTFRNPGIDLFATRINAKCKRFISWKKDPDATDIDAFTVSWADEFFYAFPPFALILKTLQKIKAESAEGIIVVPFLPSQPWYPVFQKMLI